LSEYELKYLQLLAQTQKTAQQMARERQELLEDAILELRDAGASVSVVADALGVGTSTVQNWTNNARRRRSADE
jgi:DNA-binding transcriptional regulator YiaG